MMVIVVVIFIVVVVIITPVIVVAVTIVMVQFGHGGGDDGRIRVVQTMSTTLIDFGEFYGLYKKWWLLFLALLTSC